MPRPRKLLCPYNYGSEFRRAPNSPQGSFAGKQAQAQATTSASTARRQAAVGILAKECSSKACRGLASAVSHDATRPHQFRSPIDEANRKIIRTAASVGVTGAIEVHVDDPQNEQSNQCGGNGFQNLLTARTSSSAACSPRSGRRLSPRIISFAEFYPLFFPAPVHRSVYPSSEFLA